MGYDCLFFHSFSGVGEAVALAGLRGQQASVNAFELNCRIEERREAIYELAPRRLSPSRASRPSQPSTLPTVERQGQGMDLE
ncbi:MAG: hypothetical protein ABSF73_02790 [Terriglobia bacterium]|jgi:hypothetical protein